MSEVTGTKKICQYCRQKKGTKEVVKHDLCSSCFSLFGQYVRNGRGQICPISREKFDCSVRTCKPCWAFKIHNHLLSIGYSNGALWFDEGVFEPCYEDSSTKFKKSEQRCRQLELENPQWFPNGKLPYFDGQEQEAVLNLRSTSEDLFEAWREDFQDQTNQSGPSYPGERQEAGKIEVIDVRHSTDESCELESVRRELEDAKTALAIEKSEKCRISLEKAQVEANFEDFREKVAAIQVTNAQLQRQENTANDDSQVAEIRRLKRKNQELEEELNRIKPKYIKLMECLLQDKLQ